MSFKIWMRLLPLAMLLICGAHAQTAPRISNTFPPLEDIRSPDVTIGSASTGEVFIVAYDPRGRACATPARPSCVDAMMKRAREEEKIEAIADKWSTPSYTLDLAEMLPRLFDVDAGVLHLANSGQCTWQEYAQYALDCCRAAGLRLKATQVGATRLAEMHNWVAQRPVYSVLSSAKYQALTGIQPRSWRDAVADYIERSYSSTK